MNENVDHKISGVKSAGKIIAGLFLGALIGAGVGLLSAPQSGTQTRAILKEKSIQLRDKVRTSADETRLRASERLSDVRERAGGIVRKFRRSNPEEALPGLQHSKEVAI